MSKENECADPWWPSRQLLDQSGFLRNALLRDGKEHRPHETNDDTRKLEPHVDHRAPAFGPASLHAGPRCRGGRGTLGVPPVSRRKRITNLVEENRPGIF